ncbi:MAG: hypothetical protein AVDCRST_MAG40-560, partial [uncultured Gemmatimonadaceae bacterium]
WKTGAWRISCTPASTWRPRPSWRRGSRRGGGRARPSPTSRRRRASPPWRSGSRPPASRRPPPWSCWGRPAPTGWPSRSRSTRRGTWCASSTRARHTTSSRPVCAARRPTRSTCGLSRGSPPRSVPPRGRRPRRSTTGS